MATPPSAGHRSRLLWAAAALLGLTAIVGFASRSGFGSAARASPSNGFANWAFSILLVLFVLALPMSIFALLFQGFRQPMEGRRPKHTFVARILRGFLGLLAVGLGLALFLYLRRHHHLGHLPFNMAHNASATAGGVGKTGRRQLAFQWPVAAIAAVLLAIAFAAWVKYRHRPTPRALLPVAAADDLASDVAASITDALDDLEAEPDPRRAIVAAYARMERVLARHGLRRVASETPLEYLRRVLLGLTARGDSVRSLTALFEEARFSPHVIDNAMKQTAIGALAAIRDDLSRAGA